VYKNQFFFGLLHIAEFLKYCPSIRDKYFHAMTSDTSTRYPDLLDPRIKNKS